MDGATTPSKIKTQASTTYVGLYPQNKNLLVPAWQMPFSARTVKRWRRRAQAINKRFVLHTAALLAVTLMVAYGGLAGNSSLSVALNRNNSSGISSNVDKTSTLAAGAILAHSVNALIQTDVDKKATDATAQAAMATAGDEFLASKQPIATAGSATRDVTTYKVQPGDTLSGIAQKFNITSNTIIWANNLSDDATIKPGQDLTILPVSGVLYLTAAGDTPASIAAHFQANAALIESYNNLSADPIAGGTKLIIPDGVIASAPAAPAPAQPAVLQNAFTSAPKVVNFRGGANGYAFGYCTWYVASRRAVPNNWGNASSWFYNAQADGWATGYSPRPGAIAVEYGNHVAYVESVSGGSVTVSEMNYWGNGGGWDRVSYRTTSASTFRYIY